MIEQTFCNCTKGCYFAISTVMYKRKHISLQCEGIY